MIAQKKEDSFDQKLLTELFKIVDVNTQNKDGDTVLHIAYKIGNKPFSEFVLSTQSIDITIINNDGKTFVDIAEENNRKSNLLVDITDNPNFYENISAAKEPNSILTPQSASPTRAPNSVSNSLLG